MSLYYGKLCSILLLEHFGAIVQAVGDDLFKHGSRSLGTIRVATKLPITKIKEALCVLIKFGYVSYDKSEKGIQYAFAPDKVINMLRYPRYMFWVKSHCGDVGEMILEEILKQGYDTASQVIIKTFKKLEEAPAERRVTVPILKENFETLVKNQFLVRTLCSDTCSESPEKPDYSIPELNMKAIVQMIQGNNAEPGDNKIYWRVNFDRFTQDLRDQIIVQSVAKRIDENAGELMKQMLYLMYMRTASWATTSNPIPLSEIKESVKKTTYAGLNQYVEQYLRLIEEDSNPSFIKKVCESGGGSYSIDMKETFAQLANTTIENIVKERFGSKAARIFRLIRVRKYIEQEQIHQVAMIPAKEAKLLTYTLLQENYLLVQELKKTGVAAAPTKSYILFRINLDQVVRMEIEHCYHSLYNTIQRRDHEYSSNKRMIEKQLRMTTLTVNLKNHGAPEEQLNEISEMMTPSEKLQLDKVQEVIKKLSLCELHIDDTLFILSMYLRYH